MSVKEDEMEGYIRIIDESGEDYLYPEEYFVTIEVPPGAEGRIEEEYVKLNL